jgi:RNA polymerase sigma-70 factor (ECF subfamily)
MKRAVVTSEQSNDLSDDAVVESDEQIVEEVRAGDLDRFEALMRRYNQRLYRVARAVLRDDGEAQDVVQDAWVRAFTHLDQFAGRARFSTWVTRIALYEAWGRARRRSRFESIDDDASATAMRHRAAGPDPESAAADREIASILESAIENLPEGYREVFVLREVETLSTAETAECLELTPENVKTRLHRARGLLRRNLTARAGTAVESAYAFDGARCDRIVASVMERLRVQTGSRS